MQFGVPEVWPNKLSKMSDAWQKAEVPSTSAERQRPGQGREGAVGPRRFPPRVQPA